MKCLFPYYDKVRNQYFNCGKCVHCRGNKASQWKLRCIYELDDWDSAIFLTLTYQDKWLFEKCWSDKDYPTLRKKEAQGFVKRMREDYRYNYPGKRIPKIFLCGEYSPAPKNRPHYHAIVFGLDRYNKDDRQLIIDNWCPPNAQRCEPWQFDLHRGKKDGIQAVTMANIGYTTDYASKQLYGDYAKAEFDDKGRERPFHLNSQGLGLSFALKNKERLIENCYSMIDGKKIGLPKYLRDKLGAEIKPVEKDSAIVKERFIRDNKYLVSLFEQNL